MPSVKGDAPVETYASRHCVRASMPSPAMTAGGHPTSRSGSTSATSATSRSSRNDFLNGGDPGTALARRPDRTALRVASLPVPAVVGTAMNGVAGPG